MTSQTGSERSCLLNSKEFSKRISGLLKQMCNVSPIDLVVAASIYHVSIDEDLSNTIPLLFSWVLHPPVSTSFSTFKELLLSSTSCNLSALTLLDSVSQSLSLVDPLDLLVLSTTLHSITIASPISDATLPSTSPFGLFLRMISATVFTLTEDSLRDLFNSLHKFLYAECDHSNLGSIDSMTHLRDSSGSGLFSHIFTKIDKLIFSGQFAKSLLVISDFQSHLALSSHSESFSVVFQLFEYICKLSLNFDSSDCIFDLHLFKKILHFKTDSHVVNLDVPSVFLNISIFSHLLVFFNFGFDTRTNRLIVGNFGSFNAISNLFNLFSSKHCHCFRSSKIQNSTKNLFNLSNSNNSDLFEFSIRTSLNQSNDDVFQKHSFYLFAFVECETCFRLGKFQQLLNLFQTLFASRH
ncbi:hypothetical protein GEMRC1_006357 [Eukaryota sp. GEM-RC1]